MSKLTICIPCGNKYHISSKSKYKKESVPVNMFVKDPSNTSKGIFKHCLDCRIYDRNVRSKIRKKHRENHKNSKLSAEKVSQFMYCEDRSHTGNSIYPRNKVPVELFRKIPNNPRSQLCTKCADCREKDANRSIRYAKNREKEILMEGKLYCRGCNSAKTIDEMSINLNGEISKSCKSCKIKTKERNKIRRKRYNNIKLEFIQTYEYSCQKCKNIFIKPDTNSCVVKILNTYVENDVRKVNYEGKIYDAKTFIEKFQNILEIRIIQLDHLPEEDQRRRGLLKPGEEFVEKVSNVSNMHGEHTMILEAAKCQHLCLKCHILTTIERENGDSAKSSKKSEKLNYVNKLKMKGCSMCGFNDPTLPRFMHIDHLDPKNKTMGVSEMVNYHSFSLDDVINECKDDVSRVMCGHCHIIHTHNQRKQGIIVNINREYQFLLDSKYQD